MPPSNPTNLDELTKSVKKLSDEMLTRHDLEEAGKGWATKKEVADLDARVATVENQAVQATNSQLAKTAKLESRLRKVRARYEGEHCGHNAN